MSQERQIPQDIRAEQSVLGCVVIDPESVDVLAPFLKPDDFFREAHRMIYAAALRLYERREKVDSQTLMSELSDMKSLDEVGGEEYLLSLGTAMPTSVHCEFYGLAVQRTAIRRRIVNAGTTIQSIGYDTTYEIPEALRRVDQEVALLSDKGAAGGFVSLRDSADAMHQELIASLEDGRPTAGIRYGFHELDEVTSGLHRSELIIIAGRPSTGKTSFALNIAAHLSMGEHPIPVAIFSLESTASELSKRFLSMTAQVPTGMLTYANEGSAERISSAMGVLSEAPILIEEKTMTSATIINRARLAQETSNIGLVIIDYVQMIQGRQTREANRVQEVTEISRNLKMLARELNIPVIALSQLNRGVESREGGRPKLSDLRDSGALEQDADVVIMLKTAEEANSPVRDVDVFVEKNRNGPRSEFSLRFFASQFRFQDIGRNGQE